MTTFRQLLSLPESGGAIDGARLQQIESALTQNSSSDLPWYLRFIIALGAWLSSAFFIGFALMFIGDEESHRQDLGVSGLILLALSIVVVRRKPGLFISQCCLAASFAAQFLIYYGLLPESHHPLGSAVVFSISLAAMLYWLYPDVVQRLVVCVAALQITLAWIYLGNNGGLFGDGEHMAASAVWLSQVYWLLHLAGIAWCLMRVSRHSVLLAPLGYAFVLSLAAWQVENMFNAWSFVQTLSLIQVWVWPSYIRPACTAAMLFCVIVWAAGGVETLRRNVAPFAGLALTLIAITWFGPGGVFLPLTFLTLGLFLQSRIMQGLGLILLPVFLSVYYYNLHLDLMAKSVALIGSGLALLLLRSGLQRLLATEIKSAEAA
jgi:uncharacterized membrane protein